MKRGIAEGKKWERGRRSKNKTKGRWISWPLTAERNSKRGYPPACCIRRALTRLRVNANFLTRYENLSSSRVPLNRPQAAKARPERRCSSYEIYVIYVVSRIDETCQNVPVFHE